MATIGGKEVLTVKYDKKIFALECRCNKDSYCADLDTFGENRVYHRDHLTYKAAFGQCDVCRYNPWIILPKEP